jgi:hypothetical protein
MVTAAKESHADLRAEGQATQAEAKRRGGEETTNAVLITSPEQPTPSARPDPRPTYGCPGCGHVLRVSGLGRHRVYFELDDDRSVDPVMNRACPACGHGLPGKNPIGSRP